MPHKLESTFTSYTYDQDERVFVADFLGDFDLRSIQPNGTIGPGCRRKQSGKPVKGRALELEPFPFGFQVEIDQDEPYRVQYRGVAFFEDDVKQEVIKIAGCMRFLTPIDGNIDQIRKAKKELGLREDQDQTTWVVLKP